MAICVLGDSVVKGIVYDEAKSKYVYLKNSFINILGRKADADITNYARFGCTITKGAEILNRHIDKLSLFSHTFLEFGGNDCDLKWDEISNSPRGIHLPQVPLPQFEEIYVKIINLIKAAGSLPAIMTLPPLDPEKFLNWVSKGLNRENIIKYLGDAKAIYKWHESYNTVVENISEKCAVRLLDIRGVFLRQNTYTDYLCIDGMHPNAKGHALIAGFLGNQSFDKNNKM